MYEVQVAPNVIMFIPNFVKIGQLIQKLEGGGTRSVVIS